MLEKNLLALVKERFIRKGMVYDEDSPEMVVGVIGYGGPFQYYVPPSTVYWPMQTTETTRATGSALGSDGSSAWGNATATTYKTQYVPHTSGGYTVTEYYRNISVLAGRLVPVADSTRVDLAWEGSVESSGSTADLLTVAPALLDELMTEFPDRSGKSTTRVVYLAPNGKVWRPGDH